MAQTTEDRIAQIAAGFGQGLQNYQAQRNANQQKDLLAEASRRKQALENLAAQEKLTEMYGKQVTPEIANSYLSGNLPSADQIAELSISRKLQTDQAKLARDLEDRDLKNQVLRKKLSGGGEGGLDTQIKQERLANLRNKDNPDRIIRDKQLEKLSTQNAGFYSVKTGLDAALSIFNDPSKSNDEKIKAGQGLLKTLNSPEGADAVGAEEAKRLGSYLEYQMFNLTGPGDMFGRDLPAFQKQVENASTSLAQRMKDNDAALRTISRGGSVVDLLKAAPEKIARGTPPGLIAIGETGASFDPNAPDISPIRSATASDQVPRVNMKHVQTVKSMSDEQLKKYLGIK